MNRPGGARRSGDRRLAVVRNEPGAGALAPRPRGDVEPHPSAAVPPSREADALRAELRERTADLRRMMSEYHAYRERVRRDRLAVREIAVANVLGGLLPVLDAVARARELEELPAGFRQVADLLESRTAALGLETFGEAGDPFDPSVHEAVAYSHSDEVDRPTCVGILRLGYRVGGHLLRPVQAAVAEPRPAPEASEG